jgi:hypothetical protein
MGRLSSRRGAVAAAFACALAGAVRADAATLIQNGGFTEGSDGVPAQWRADGWKRDLSQFEWETTPDGAGVVSITNVEPNDAHWCQTVAVQPDATYRVSARTKTRNVGRETAGALIAIEPRIADTADVRGTQDWQELTIDVAAGERTTLDVCVRLGSYANLNTGSAWFTDVRMVQLSAPPPRTGWLSWRPPTAWARASWFTIALPLFAGLLLAFGLGIGRRSRP